MEVPVDPVCSVLVAEESTIVTIAARHPAYGAGVRVTPRPNGWADVRVAHFTIEIDASFFNPHRMLRPYGDHSSASGDRGR